METFRKIILIMIGLIFSNVLSAQVPATLNLRSTANFVILAGSEITGIPPVSVVGDVGLSPATGSNIAGFSGSNVNGILYTVDASGPAGSVANASLLTTAKSDLTIAYNDAAGRTPVPTGPFLNPGSANLGGLNLVPGLYKFTSDCAITGSNVTLTGGPSDVWIFQIVSSLNVGSGIHVILAGGAQAANIFWQVGSSATLGTYSVFKGTILADQSISFGTGATIDGRALARIAAVTMGSAVTTTRPDLIEIPPAPILASPLNNAINISLNPVIVWNASTGATSYMMQVATDSGFTNLIYNQSGLTSTSQQVNGLINNTLYYWRANAANAAGTSNWSTVWSFRAVIAAPNPPTLFIPANAAGTGVNPTLIWNASTGATSYRMQVATDSGFTSIVYNQSGLTSTSQQMSGLTNNIPYYWRVNASNSIGTSGWSSAWSFTITISTASPLAPVLLTPVNTSAGIALNPTLSWNASTGATSYTMQVSTDNGFINLIYNQSGLTSTSQQLNGLINNTPYYWRVSATNSGGTSGWSSAWSFTTLMFLPVLNLRSNDNFVILAGAAVTGIPPVTIRGNVGLSPAAGTFIQGFDGSNVTGSIYVVDAFGPTGSTQNANLLTTAKGDLTIAYNDAANRVPVPTGTFLNPGTGNIGGLNLVPGLYKFTSDAAITGSNVTLTGNATDVWIFQIVSSLNVGNGIHVILSGGAQAANIFWQVGSSATIGTNSIFKGTILADQSISFGTGSDINGRALAFTGSVTLGSGVIITKPGLTDTSVAPILISPINNAISVSSDPIFVWKASTGASSYTLQIATDNGFNNLIYNHSGLTLTAQEVNGLINNSLYYWRVNAVKSGVTSNWSTVWSFTTISAIPSAPTLLDPANTATKVAVNPTLSWNAATGALSYTLQVATDSGFVNLIYNQNGVTSTSQLVAGLNYNTLYYWKVNAVNTGGTSIWSTIWSFTTTIPIPGAPVLTTPLYNATNTSLNPVFSWEIVNGATGYDLQVSTTNDFLTYAIIIETSLTTNNYSSGSFNQNTTYYWRVRAKNYAGNSSWTQSKFTTKQTFSVPTLLLPENNSKQNSNNIIFSWSKIDSVIYYELIVSKYSDFRTNVFDSKTLTTNTYTILGLDKSATYYWKVREIGNSEIGDWSQTFNFSILTNIRAPLLVYPDNNSYGIGKTIAFKWGAVAEANVYELQIAADMNFTNIILNYIGLTNATQTVSDLLRDINLFWRVRGVKDNDTGNWSEVWSFRTASTSLSTPVITFPIDNSTNISINPIAKWNTVVGATGYEAIFSDKPDLSNVIYVLVLGAPSATLKNLSYNKSYYWKVLARKDLATSEWTAINKFTTGSTGLNVERLDEIADSYSLLQNYPNPFNPSTNITYTISEPSHVTIRIFDVYGREIATLVNENLAMGKYSTTWEPSSTRGGLSSGVYYYQLQAGKYNEVRKMMYIR